MKVNISRKKSGLKYAPKLNKGWEWTNYRNAFNWHFLVFNDFHPKYRKLRAIELNEELPF